MANVTQVDLNSFFGRTQKTLLDLLNRELKFDEVADSWLFMRTPWPMLTIVTAYLLFVLKLGPMMMKNREPFNIKIIILVYDFLQTAHNLYIMSSLFLVPGALTYITNHVCHPDESENNSLFIRMYYIQGWHFVMSKVFDLFDTVFFVLRKKQSHVTFLHVYHHANMVIVIWTYMRFFKGHQGVVCGFMNSTVHMIMYGYYFLSALGPNFKKYLRWKKYLTSLQIIQFIVGLIYAAFLFIYDCEFPRLFCMYMIFDVSLFLYLFIVFYKKTYNQKEKSQ